jgi:hypothetical protein
VCSLCLGGVGIMSPLALLLGQGKPQLTVIARF